MTPAPRNSRDRGGSGAQAQSDGGGGRRWPDPILVGRLPLSAWLIVISLSMFQLPKVLPEGPVAGLFQIAGPLSLLIYGLWGLRKGWHSLAAHGRRLWRQAPVFLTATLAFVLLQLVGFIRASVPGTVRVEEAVLFEGLLFFGLAVFLFEAGSRSVERFPELMLGALLMYVSLNSLLWLLGVRPSGEIYTPGVEAGVSMLRPLGVEMQAVLFPLADGVNAFSGVVGACWVGWAAWLIGERGKMKSWLLAPLSAMALILLLLTDGRGALLSAALALPLVLFLRWRPNGLSWTALAPVLLPVLLVGGAALAPDALWAKVGVSGTNIRSLSGRTVIWKESLEELASPRAVHLVGYGHAGHVNSGLSREYLSVFERPSRPELQGPHNLILQLVFDIGYLGAAAFMVMTWKTLRALGGDPQDGVNGAHLGLAGLLVYLLLLGSIERVPTVYNHVTFAPFFLAVLWLLAKVARDVEVEAC